LLIDFLCLSQARGITGSEQKPQAQPGQNWNCLKHRIDGEEGDYIFIFHNCFSF
jgi:hypothetical protein